MPGVTGCIVGRRRQLSVGAANSLVGLTLQIGAVAARAVFGIESGPVVFPGLRHRRGRDKRKDKEPSCPQPLGFAANLHA